VKIIADFLAYLLVRFFYLPFTILSYENCLRYGIFLSTNLYPFAKKHRIIAYENISFAFPNLTEEEKLNLVKKHFVHLGRLLAGTLYAPRINSDWMKKYLIYDEGALKIENDTNLEGVGVVLVSGHLGSWEIIVQFMGMRMKGAGIYKTIRNKYVDAWIKRLRSNNGILLIRTDESTRCMKLLKEGYWVGFGSDQNAGGSGIFVNFLNRPASTFQGPALMAYLTNSKMLLYSAICGEDGKIQIRVKDMGFINKKDFASREDCIRRYTEIWTNNLEAEIRLFPEQYFWVHRRWRTKPGDFKGQI
jgi:KDO2-lipid IV(A) lauroyltransferase